jgi:hypothetical protein
MHVNHYQFQENAYQEMHPVFDEHYSSKCKDQKKVITLFHSLSETLNPKVELGKANKQSLGFCLCGG